MSPIESLRLRYLARRFMTRMLHGVQKLNSSTPPPDAPSNRLERYLRLSSPISSLRRRSYAIGSSGDNCQFLLCLSAIMITLLPAHFVNQPVTKADLSIASLAFGFTFGIGFLTTWTAIKQTAGIHGRYGASKLNSPYVWMIWLEILVCLIFAVICWLHLYGYIPPSFAFYFVILSTWALQVQFLLQIIINRVSILLTDRRKALRLKVGVAILITAVNISVYAIWIPARLQISARYIHINEWWDRCEKVIYLLVDAMLNWYFVHTVKEQLVKQGLKKYDKLVRFNVWIIGFSLSMDILIISMMSLKNTFVYMQFHPLAYIVKLNIEMSMAELIAKVAHSSSTGNDLDLTETSHTFASSHNRSTSEKLVVSKSPRTSRITRPHWPQPTPNKPKQAFTAFKGGDWIDNSTYSCDVELQDSTGNHDDTHAQRRSSLFDDAFGFGTTAGIGTDNGMAGVTVMREVRVCVEEVELENGRSSGDDSDLDMDTTREGSVYCDETAVPQYGAAGEGRGRDDQGTRRAQDRVQQYAREAHGGNQGMDLKFCSGEDHL